MSKGVAFFGSSTAGPPPPPAPPLDSYSSDLIYAFARERLLTSWTGALYRVRRDSDNTEQDITPAADGTDTASLTAFVGSASGYVTVWYDQSGAGLDLAQATTTKQPQVVNAGTVLPNFVPDNVDDFMQSSGNVGSLSAGATCYYVGVPAPNDGTPTPVIFGFGGTRYLLCAYSSPASRILPIVGSGNCTINDNGRVDGARCFQGNLAGATITDQILCRSGGVTNTNSSVGGSYSTSPLDAGPITYAAFTGGSTSFSPAQMRALVGYSVLHSTTTIDAINSALA